MGNSNNKINNKRIDNSNNKINNKRIDNSYNNNKINKKDEDTVYIKLLEEMNYKYKTLLEEKNKELEKKIVEISNSKNNIDKLNKEILKLKKDNSNNINYNSLYNKYRYSILVIIDTLARQCNFTVTEENSQIILSDKYNSYKDMKSIKEYLNKFSGSLNHKKLLLFLEIFNELE